MGKQNEKYDYSKNKQDEKRMCFRERENEKEFFMASTG